VFLVCFLPPSSWDINVSEVEICSLLGYNAVSNGNPVPLPLKDYHSTLRYTPEERRSHQHHGGSLRSHF
jgi:hypothetical protein